MRRNAWMLRITFASVLLASLLVAGTFAVTARRGNPTPDRMASTTLVGQGTPGTSGMMGNTNQAAPYDVQFLDEMIPHHEMAIGMARNMISQSSHPELRDLAQRIITGQQQQIDQMQTWLQQWYPNASQPRGMMGGGMMSGNATGMMGGAMHTAS